MTDEYDNVFFDIRRNIGRDFALANGSVTIVINGAIMKQAPLRKRFDAVWNDDTAKHDLFGNGVLAVAPGMTGAFSVQNFSMTNAPALSAEISVVRNDSFLNIRTGSTSSPALNAGIALQGESFGGAAIKTTGNKANWNYNTGKTTIFVKSSPDRGNAPAVSINAAEKAVAPVSAVSGETASGIVSLNGSTGTTLNDAGSDAGAVAATGRTSVARRSFTINAADAAKFTSCQIGVETASAGIGQAISVSGKSYANAMGYAAGYARPAVENYYYITDPVSSIGIVGGGAYIGRGYFDEETGEYVGGYWHGWIDPGYRYGEIIDFGDWEWEEYSVELTNDWVHFEDGDYSKIDLEYAAKLSFTVNTAGAASFTIYRCVEAEDGSYTLTELQTTALSFGQESGEYEATTKALLLNAGQYYISIQSPGAAEDGSDYKVYINDDETEFFTEGDNSDDWTDIKTLGAYGEVGYAGILDENSFDVMSDWVGFGDAVDFAGFTLVNAAKLSFLIDADDAVSFTLYKLVEGKNGLYSLKTIQTTALFFNKEFEDYEATTKALLLEAGDYYISVNSANAAKGGSAYYNVYLNDEETEFFTEGCNGDDWTDLKTLGVYGEVGYVGWINENSFEIASDWVGYGDAADYMGFTLDSAAKLSFLIDATGAASFSIYKLVQGKDGTYSLKTLQTTTLSFNKEFEEYEAATKALLLEAGEYYISINSANAAKGGSAYYNVYLNDEETEFFTQGSSRDDWTDLKTAGDFGDVDYIGVVDEFSGELAGDWVGFGDAIDYMGFSLLNSAKLSFTINATDAASFTVYKLVQAKNGTYSLKALQTISLSYNREFEYYESVTKALLLEAGDYYFSVQSTNAEKGGSAYYNVYLNNEDSEFYTQSDSSDNWSDLETLGPGGSVGDAGLVDEFSSDILSGWVGFGDADFARIELVTAANLSFLIDATGAAEFTICQLVQARNGKYSLNEILSTSLSFNTDTDSYEAATKKLLLNAGEYYISMRASDAANGGNADYNIRINTESSEFFTEADNWDDWTDVRTQGEYGEVGYVGYVDESCGELTANWVGYGDEIDYAGFTIGSAAKLSFTLSSTGAASFTVYQLVRAKNGTYSLKTLQTTDLSFNTETDDYEAKTKALLLEAGDYYFSVQSPDAAKGGSAHYSVSLNTEDSRFFTEGGNWDDWTDIRMQGEFGEVGNVGLIDDYTGEIVSDWVGFGDAVDYMGFSIWNDANLSFTLNATDAASFTIYRLVQAKNGTYTLNELQTTALSFDKDSGAYGAVTKALSLEAGDYYFSMQSANAAKGGSAYYSVHLNGEGSEFFANEEEYDEGWIEYEPLGEWHCELPPPDTFEICYAENVAIRNAPLTEQYSAETPAVSTAIPVSSDIDASLSRDGINLNCTTIA